MQNNKELQRTEVCHTTTITPSESSLTKKKDIQYVSRWQKASIKPLENTESLKACEHFYEHFQTIMIKVYFK